MNDLNVTPWLAMDEGCYECGEPSGIVGLFATKEEAEAANELASKHQQDDWHGQHAFVVYHLIEGPFSEHRRIEAVKA